MFEIKFDFSQFERKATELQAAIDQVPFAASRALNQSLINVKRVIVAEWPRYVTQRNASFISAALAMKFRKKTDLRVELYDKLGRGNLAQHARGGISKPKKANQFAIPVNGAVTRTARGLRTGQRPSNLKGAFVTSKGVFQRIGRNVQLMYVFKPQVTIKKGYAF